MKKWLMFALVLCLVAWAMYQVNKEPPVPIATFHEKKAPLPETDYDWGVTMTVVNPTPTGCTLKVTQSGGNPTGSVACGEDYFLQALRDGDWYGVVLIADDGYAIPAIAYILSEEYPRNFNLNWEKIYGALPAGTYRIGKAILDGRAPGDYDKQNHYTEPFTIE